MKFTLNLLLFLFILLTFGDKSFSQIKKICKKEKKESICIKNLLERRSKLQKGEYIEIPVIPKKK